MKSLFSLLVTLSWTSFHANANSVWSIGKIVSTTSGRIKGHPATLPGTQEVSEYLGVRFGQDTGGENRFMKPEPYSGESLIEASNFVSFEDLCPIYCQ
jgi:hypothetical protein